MLTPKPVDGDIRRVSSQTRRIGSLNLGPMTRLARTPGPAARSIAQAVTECGRPSVPGVRALHGVQPGRQSADKPHYVKLCTPSSLNESGRFERPPHPRRWVELCKAPRRQQGFDVVKVHCYCKGRPIDKFSLGPAVRQGPGFSCDGSTSTLSDSNELSEHLLRR